MKITYFVGMVLGSVIVTAIDHLIGVSFNDVGTVVEIAHKVTYMLWGGAIVGMSKWLVE